MVVNSNTENLAIRFTCRAGKTVLSPAFPAGIGNSPASAGSEIACS
jgi:hypothetical protein